MSDEVLAARDHFVGQTCQDIALVDGAVPELLQQRSNPPQTTEDIPFARYIDRKFFDLEMHKMWRRVWQYACRDEHIPQIGDYYVYDIGRYSLIVVRTAAGLRAYHNSCLHRGTKLKASGSSGGSASLQCPYHGWDWHLDGSIKNIPCAWEFPHLKEEQLRLPQARVEAWNGFIFVNYSSPASSIRTRTSCAGSAKACTRARKARSRCRFIKSRASATCIGRSTSI